MEKTYILRKKEYGTAADLPEDLSDATVVIDWEDRSFFRSSYGRLRDAGKILFLFGDVRIDVADTELVERYRSEALSEKNYRRCKTINRALIEYSVIRQLPCTGCYPAEMQLETTDICNARCIICSHFYRQGEHTVTGNMDVLHSLSEVLPYLDTVFLHGNGEPFLVRDIDEYIEYIGRYDIRCTANTNLSVLTDRNIETIGRYFSELNISIDGADARTYEYIRRGLSFDTLLENCRRLRKGCPGLYMRMWSVIMRQNAGSLCELVRLASELGFNEIAFVELSSDERLKNKGDVMLGYPNYITGEIEKARREAERLRIRFVAPDYGITFDRQGCDEEKELCYSHPVFRDEDYFEDLLGEIREMPESGRAPKMHVGNRQIPCLEDFKVKGICDWTVERPFVDLEGNVSLCCINQHIVLGNLFEKTFDEIWQGPAARNIRKSFYAGKLPYFCSGCEFILQERLTYLGISAKDTENLHGKIRLGGNT